VTAPWCGPLCVAKQPPALLCCAAGFSSLCGTAGTLVLRHRSSRGSCRSRRTAGSSGW
jgi:hypothetical protein